MWEQYGPVTSGSAPAGLLQNIKPFLQAPNPYVPGNKSWLSLFPASVTPDMTPPNGDIDLYTRGRPSRPGCSTTRRFLPRRVSRGPTDLGEFMADLAKLHGAGIQPFIFVTAGLCNPSWYERLATSSLLADEAPKFDVNHAQVTTGLDIAVGVEKGHHQHEQPA